MKKVKEVFDMDLYNYISDPVVNCKFVQELVSNECAANDEMSDDWDTESIQLPAHAATSIFPAMGEAEYQELKADSKRLITAP
jgi:hypothetical protein